LDNTALICKQRFNFEGRIYFPGEIVYPIERVARRWVSRGLCDYADPSMIKPAYEKHDKVSIVILVKDALDYTKKCIDTLLNCTDNYELIIVDNDSSIDTKEYLKTVACAEYTIVTNDKNKGISYGWNQGIKIAKYDYVCLLNSDTLLTPDWLKKLMRGFKYSADIGMVGPTSNGGPTDRGPQIVGEVTVEKINDYATSLPEDFVESPVVGFCFVIARKVFDKIGVFDYKRYGLACHEDIDILFRSRKAGFKSLWCRGSYVHHFGNRTMLEMGIDVKEIRKGTEKILTERRNDSNIYVENDVELGKIEVISDKKVKIGFVVYSATSRDKDPASTRIRVNWPLKYLNGIISESFDELATCDVVVFQTRCNPQDIILARNLKHSGVKIIADFTDPHWLREYQSYNQHITDMVGMADTITLCTDKLEETFKNVFPRKRTFVLRDRLDLDLYKNVKKHIDKKSYRILWHGCFCNIPSIDLARQDLERLGLEFDITLVCVFDGTGQHKVKPFKNIKVEVIEWSNQAVIDELLKSDISINPRYDNWKAYKSDNKTSVAWTCGIVCIERNFYYEIKKYLSSASLRNNQAKILRELVIKDYDVKDTAKEWQEIAESLINPPKIEKPNIIKEDITVYTSIIGDYDDLRDDQFIEDGVEYVAFLDKAYISKVWNIKPVFMQFIDPSRQAKIYKILPWQYLDTEYSIWIDGRMAVNVSPNWLIDTYLKDADIALFAHHKRNDIYEEYAGDPKFMHRKLEPEYLFKMQIDKYQREGFPKHSGLYECTVILRRHTEEVKRLCLEWWSEITAYTVSDQVSFVYCAIKQGIKINIIPGNVWNNNMFIRGEHLVKY